MPQPYNQFRALLAISRASLRAILRSPSAVLFSLGVPLIFILVFGSIQNGGVGVEIGLANPADSSNYVVRSLLASGVVSVRKEKDSTAQANDLARGNIAAIVRFDSSRSAAGFTQYLVGLQTSSAARDKYPIFKMALAQVIQYIEERNIPDQYRLVRTRELPIMAGREYTMIDFILPGMLGFSLLSAAVFGVAFVFFNLRQTLVLKRFFATPINRMNIVFGEALSRIVFQLMAAVILILVGHYLFHFTLIHGFATFAEMFALCVLGLLVFMGFGFIVSSVAKNESSIPAFANLFTLPQLLLCGTFFSTQAFPGWLQKFCNVLPLKQLNDAMRNVAFEGAHLTDCWTQIGILAAWGVVIYLIAIKTFRWE